MGSGNRSIRFKIFLLLLLPLLSLSALWGFVLNLTVGDGAALLQANSVYQTIGVSSTDLGLQLQAERAQSSVAITSRVLTSGIGEQRGRTDRSVEKFRDAALADDSHGPELSSALESLLHQLDRLPAIRAGIDSGQNARLEVLSNYNRILDSVFLLYDQLAAVPDLSIFQQAAAMQSMGNAREMIARENALISGALIDRRMTQEERTAFGEYASTRRFLHARGVSALDAELGGPYRDTFDSTAFEKFVALEKAIAEATGDALPPRGDRLEGDHERGRDLARPDQHRLLQHAGRPDPVGGHRHHGPDRGRRRDRPARGGRLDHHLGPLRPPPGRRAGRAPLAETRNRG